MQAKACFKTRANHTVTRNTTLYQDHSEGSKTLSDIPAGWGRLTGLLLRTVRAGEREPVSGARVRLHAWAPFLKSGDALYAADTVDCTTDETGRLCGPDGKPGAMVLASDGPTVPTNFSWRVTISAPSIASRSWDILVPEGETTDLFSAVPVPSDPGGMGELVAEWVRVRDEVYVAVAAVDTDRQWASAARAGAEQAAQRSERFAGDAQASAIEAARYAIEATLGALPGTLVLTFPSLAAGPFPHSVIIPIREA